MDVTFRRICDVTLRQNCDVLATKLRRRSFFVAPLSCDVPSKNRISRLEWLVAAIYLRRMNGIFHNGRLQLTLKERERTRFHQRATIPYSCVIQLLNRTANIPLAKFLPTNIFYQKSNCDLYFLRCRNDNVGKRRIATYQRRKKIVCFRFVKIMS